MKRYSVYSLTLAVAALTTAQVPARVIAPQPIYERIGRADVVVVGKVDSVEDKNAVLPDKTEYKIAVVKISDPLLNAKGLTHIRVGFHPGGNTRFPHLNLTPGQEACFFLTQKAGQTFYTTPMYFDVVDKKAATFEKDVTEAKRCAKLLADPDASLSSKDEGERLLTASMLLTRYRTVNEGRTKTAAVDAAQSKKILLVIAEADWNKQPAANQPGPHQVFTKLGLTAMKDGWATPKDIKELPEKAKEWIKTNLESYRIQKYVAD